MTTFNEIDENCHESFKSGQPNDKTCYKFDADISAAGRLNSITQRTGAASFPYDFCGIV
jgi:hypothetical protein